MYETAVEVAVLETGGKPVNKKNLAVRKQSNRNEEGMNKFVVGNDGKVISSVTK